MKPNTKKIERRQALHYAYGMMNDMYATMSKTEYPEQKKFNSGHFYDVKYTIIPNGDYNGRLELMFNSADKHSAIINFADFGAYYYELPQGKLSKIHNWFVVQRLRTVAEYENSRPGGGCPTQVTNSEKHNPYSLEQYLVRKHQKRMKALAR